MTSPVYIGGGMDLQNTDTFTKGDVEPAPSPRGSKYTGTEGQVAQKIDAAGTWSLLTVLVTANTATNTLTLTSRVNSAAGNQTVAVTGGSTGQFQDGTHSDSIAQGNTLDLNAATSESANTTQLASLGCKFQGTSVTATILASADAAGGAGSLNGGSAGVTRFVPIIGTGDNSNGWYIATEANVQQKNISAGSYSRLGTFVTSNTSTNAATVTFRKNTANGNQTFSIGASSTGYIEDTTHTDSVVSGDLINVATTSGAGTVNSVPTFMVTTFTASSTNVDLRQGSTRTASQGFSNTVTNYMKICGGSLFVFATESQSQIKFPFAGTFSNLIANLVSTSGSGAQNMVTRINGGNGNQTISINPAATGYSQDATHSDTFNLNDLVNLTLPAIGSGSIAFNMIGLSGGVTTTVNANITGVHATGVARAVTTTSSASVTLGHVTATGVARAVSPTSAVLASITGVHATGTVGTLTTTSGTSVTLTPARAITQVGQVVPIAQNARKTHTRTWGSYR
jgi:hypothetical protein